MQKCDIEQYDESGNQIYLLKHNHNQALLERIFNYRKFQFDKIVGLPLNSHSIIPVYHDIIDPLYDDTVYLAHGDFDQILFDIQKIFSDLDTDLLHTHPIITAFEVQSTYDDFGRQVKVTVDSVGQESSTLLFVFAIAAFYIIVRSENPQLKIQNYNKVFSFVFISLLVSSMVVRVMTLNGGDNNDKIYGHEGNDNLNGNNGNDIIHGGQGNDALDGGDGTDKCNGAQGSNTITNCESEDKKMKEEQEENDDEGHSEDDDGNNNGNNKGKNK
jgi:hypothetical protein